ncbi:MAG: nucleotide exchange factor GrpE [Acidobacteria bacterium]|nr:nucleotide exchange factor GrpE [Acidobacteriota bacterium]MBI3657383.1 nucleotide exchange factor GrpE [Acidobacteriota bacterium]
MSNSKVTNLRLWDQSPFIIDESPDPVDGPAGIVDESVALAEEITASKELLEGVQDEVARVGRDLYKHTTRMETLFAHIVRLRTDISSLKESQPDDNKIIEVLRAILPVIDGLNNLAAAAQAAAAQSDGSWAEILPQLRQAIEIVQQKSRNQLKEIGVTAMDTIGKPFDAQRHVAVDTAFDPDLPPAFVVGEDSSGYLYRDRVLRPAQVVVNKPESTPKPADVSPVTPDVSTPPSYSPPD